MANRLNKEVHNLIRPSTTQGASYIIMKLQSSIVELGLINLRMREEDGYLSRPA